MSKPTTKSGDKPIKIVGVSGDDSPHAMVLNKNESKIVFDGDAAQLKTNKKNKRTKMMKEFNAMNLESEIKNLIANAEFSEEAGIFAAKYGAFHYGYQSFLDWNGTGCGEAADHDYLRGMLSWVEDQTYKVNFFAKAVAGYPVNIVGAFDADNVCVS